MKITIQHEKLKTPIIALIFKEIEDDTSETVITIVSGIFESFYFRGDSEEAAIEEFVNHWYKKSSLLHNYFV